MQISTGEESRDCARICWWERRLARSLDMANSRYASQSLVLLWWIGVFYPLRGANQNTRVTETLHAALQTSFLQHFAATSNIRGGVGNTKRTNILRKLHSALSILATPFRTVQILNDYIDYCIATQ